jgi:hypothetical protein
MTDHGQFTVLLAEHKYLSAVCSIDLHSVVVVPAVLVVSDKQLLIGACVRLLQRRKLIELCKTEPFVQGIELP